MKLFEKRKSFIFLTILFVFAICVAEEEEEEHDDSIHEQVSEPSTSEVENSNSDATPPTDDNSLENIENEIKENSTTATIVITKEEGKREKIWLKVKVLSGEDENELGKGNHRLTNEELERLKSLFRLLQKMFATVGLRASRYVSYGNFCGYIGENSGGRDDTGLPSDGCDFCCMIHSEKCWSKRNNEKCDPFKQPYSVNTTSLVCQDKPNSCEFNMCMCDTELVKCMSRAKTKKLCQ